MLSFPFPESLTYQNLLELDSSVSRMWSAQVSPLGLFLTPKSFQMSKAGVLLALEPLQ